MKTGLYRVKKGEARQGNDNSGSGSEEVVSPSTRPNSGSTAEAAEQLAFETYLFHGVLICLGSMDQARLKALLGKSRMDTLQDRIADLKELKWKQHEQGYVAAVEFAAQAIEEHAVVVPLGDNR